MSAPTAPTAMQNFKTNCAEDCGSLAGWGQNAKYVAIALLTIAAIGLAIGVAMKMGAFNMSFGSTLASSIPNFATYLISASATVLGIAAILRVWAFFKPPALPPTS
ncbi:MAG: hypothetical protein S4CHLAM45_15340 [Chlamydiales bacterium]|nr:hypothetical protein [Chlamydiales bacterium]MCH9620151.1 hypothetical protein [Chlamydiales bacterium]MCH9623621.1 hypothetical protein [Chlamydiales bacterium]